MSQYQKIGVVGAGTMGAGIAQLAASFGHSVVLFDVVDGAADEAVSRIAAGLDRLVARGKKTQTYRDTCVENIQVATSLAAFKDCGLVIEAIVEGLDIKHELFKQLEAIVDTSTVLASNTSSISITAIANTTQNPKRVVGMHFFNPAPVMKLVEVIAGLKTDSSVAKSIYDLAESWGKQPILAKSTPGFVANRVARPFYAEALKMLEEGIADAAVIDGALRDCAGFRMGPFQLMDLIGVDVNYAVTSSVFEAMYFDPKFKPSLLQKEMVEAGLLGRKSGQGFFQYSSNEETPLLGAPDESSNCPKQVVAAGDLGPLERVLDAVADSGMHVGRQVGDGLIYVGEGTLALSDGRTATIRSQQQNLANLVLMDWVEDFAQSPRVILAAGDLTSVETKRDVTGLFQKLGKVVHWVDDLPGLVVLRTVSMLANEGADTVANGVCQPEEVDKATKFGLNYPKGPLEWCDEIGVARVSEVVRNLAYVYGDDHYRCSRVLQRTLHGTGYFYSNRAQQS